jgi:hypothetical protein
MKHEPRPGRPRSLSEQLKRLDDAQYPGGMPRFDLDAVIRRGHRRRTRRTAATFLSAAAAIAVIAVVFTGSLPGVLRGSQGSPAGSVQVEDGHLTYAQLGTAVTVSRGDRQVARVSLSAASQTGNHGQVTVAITTSEPFWFNTAQLVWKGGLQDQEPEHAAQILITARSHTLVLDYREIDTGQLIWAADPAQITGAWTIPAHGPPAADPKARSGALYLQVGQTVYRYQGGRTIARVTPLSMTYPGGNGRLVIRVTATTAFTFTASQFIWEDPSGGDHDAVDGARKITVPAASTRDVTVEYPGVGEGDVIWAPDEKSAGGVWNVPAG